MTSTSKQSRAAAKFLNPPLDYAQTVPILNERTWSPRQTKHVESTAPACLTDLLSGVFYASSQTIALGHNFVIPVVDNMHVVPVTMKVEGREEIKTPLGSFHTLRVQPTADAGVVKNRGNIWIWYTDDERHLPVQMRARLFWAPSPSASSARQQIITRRPEPIAKPE